MKLKDLMINNDEKLKPQIHKNYNEFLKSDVPNNSIEIDASGKIVSDRLSVLNFIQFLLQEYEYLPENNDNKEFDIEEKNKKKKNKKKKVPYSKLSLKKRKKIVQDIDHFPHDTNDYYSKYGNRLDYYQ